MELESVNLRRTTLGALAGLAVAGLCACAMSPSSSSSAGTMAPISVASSIMVDAPPATVWMQIKDFDAIAKWHPAVATSPADKGNSVGSVRMISLKGGGALEETLESYSAESRSYTYRIKDGGALPVAGYRSTIAVAGAGARSRIDWSSTFTAAKGTSDDAAKKAVEGVYEAGLGNIKKMAEGK